MNHAIEKLRFHNNQTPEQLTELEDYNLTISESSNEDPNKAMEHCKFYETTALRYQHKEHFAEATYKLGLLSYFLGNNDQALDLCKNALKIASNNELLYKIQICLGAIYTYFGEFSIAIDIYNNALNTNNSVSASGIYNNIAAIYFRQKEYRNAIEYFDKALEKSTNNLDMVLAILNNTGRSFLELSDINNAEKILYRAKELLIGFKNPVQEMINNLNIGLLLYKQNKFSEAYDALFEAYTKCKLLKLKSNLYSATIFLANSCIKKGSLSRANKLFLEAKKLVKGIDHRLHLEVLNDFVNFKERCNNYKHCTELYAEIIFIKNLITKKESEEEINSLSIKFKNTEHENSLEKLKKDQAFQQQQLKQADELKKKNQQQIRIHKKLLAAHNDLLESKTLRSQMNPHFVYTTLESIGSLISSKENQQADFYLQEFSILTRQIFDNNSKKQITLQEELDFCEHYLLLENMKLGTSIHFQVAIEKEINCEKTMIPSMIIQPLLENAIRHAGITENGSKGIVHLKIRIDNQFLCFEVRDKGVGMKSPIMNKILCSDQESSLIIINKRINIFNRQPLETISLHLSNQKNEGLCCRFMLNYQRFN